MRESVLNTSLPLGNVDNLFWAFLTEFGDQGKEGISNFLLSGSNKEDCFFLPCFCAKPEISRARKSVKADGGGGGGQA